MTSPGVMVRSAVFGLWFTLTVVPFAAFVVVASLVIRGTPLYRLATRWCRFIVDSARVICRIEHRVTGWEHVDAAALAGHPLIVCPKHQSAWETFFLSAVMPRPLAFVFKRELLWVPFFGWALARLDMIHIDRSRRAEALRRVSHQGRRLMDQGNWVIMFPEGTRTARGAAVSYKLGAARLAVDTGVPILPLAITSARCWPRAGWWLYPGRIDVSIGPPIPTAGRDPQWVMHEVQRWIEAEMRRLDPQAYGVAAACTTCPPPMPGGSRA